MKFTRHLAAALSVLALVAVPALAFAGQGGNVPQNQGTAHNPNGTTGTTGTTGPSGAHTPKGKAYGWYCRNESKKHVKGQKGTPFSQCVRAMHKLATGKTDNPAKACKSESKKHVKGQKGTPFSKCVSAGAKLQNDQD